MSKPTIDESIIGAVFWVILFIEVNLTWILMDTWLHAHHHEYLTTEFREGLRQPLMGAILAFITGGAIAALIWHLFVQRDS